MSQAGWSYTIVTDKDAFTQELRSGVYSTYLLLSERVKLDEKVQKELREAVYRGEGLLEAGGDERRQCKLDEALGIRFKGKHSGMTDLVLLESDLHPSASGAFALSDKKPRVRLEGAVVNGVFMKQGQQTDDPAVTSYDYGLGRSVYVGYDLLAEAALTDDIQSIHAQLILAGLNYVDYSSAAPIAGQAYPLRLSLSNQGIATPGRAQIVLPADVMIIDSGSAQLSGTTTLSWSFDLDLDETIVFDTWVGLPNRPVEIEATVQTGIEPDYVDYATTQIALTPQPALSVQDALDAVEALDDRAYRKAEKYLRWAAHDVTSNCPQKALEALVRAADALIRIGTPESASIREMVAFAIRTVSLTVEPISCNKPGDHGHGCGMRCH